MTTRPGLAKAFEGAEGVFAMIPPDFALAPGLPDQKRMIAAIREALEQAKPGKAVFLSSIGSEQPSALGLITSTHLMEQATRTLSIPVPRLSACARRTGERSRSTRSISSPTVAARYMP